VLVGVLSDTHDNLLNVDKAVKIFNERGVEVVLHCGDFISPFVIRRLWKLKSKLIGVFGNNDGDKALLMRLAKERGFELHNQPHSFEIEGRKILMLHGWGGKEETIALISAISKQGNYDIVVYGHTHEPFEEKMGGTLVLNPGETYGYLTGKASVALLDVSKLEVEFVEI